jgi:outer membrane protein OmpA-like peptidoglycan-associated protein
MLKPLAIAGAALGAMTLTACDPTIEDRTRTGQGAATGAAIGAIAGAISDDDDRLERAAIGAVVGAGIGAAVGEQLDRQAQDLRRQIGDDRVTIQNTGSQLIVTMPQDIVFATDSAAVRADLQDDIRALAGNLQQYPASTVQVIGHTDNTGSASYNQDLSERRARSVAGILFEQGVNPGRVATIGRGEAQPVATNQTPEGRQANRRVEIVITPTG